MFFISIIIKTLSHHRIKQPILTLKTINNSFRVLKEKIKDVLEISQLVLWFKRILARVRSVGFILEIAMSYR